MTGHHSLRLATLPLSRMPLSTTRNSLRLRSDLLRASAAASLPSETLFLMDGTAMLYLSHFSQVGREGKSPAFSDSYALQWLARQTDETRARLVEETPPNASSPSSLSCAALVAAASSFAHLVNVFHPAYLAVAFDSPHPTFRTALYPPYKKQRKKARHPLSSPPPNNPSLPSPLLSPLF